MNALAVLTASALALACSLVQSTAAILPGGPSQDTALREAALLHNIQGVKDALRNGGDVNAPSGTARRITPLGATAMGTWRPSRDRAADLLSNEIARKLASVGLNDDEIDR